MASPEEAPVSLTNRELFKKVLAAKFHEQDPSTLTFILNIKKIEASSLDDIDLEVLNSFISNFTKNARRRWKEAGSRMKNLEQKHSSWLDQEVQVPDLNPKKSLS